MIQDSVRELASSHSVQRIHAESGRGKVQRGIIYVIVESLFNGNL